jgi:parallel beta-helix repeat protein
VVDYSGTNTSIQGNTIANQLDSGVLLYGSQHTVEGNTITENGQAGVEIGGTGNISSVQNNSISDNSGLGIDLGGDGVTFNNQGTITGPNNYQNYPVLTLATSDGSTTRVIGTLVSDANQTYSIDVYANQTCDPSAFGEGQTYLGSFNTTTDGSGLASFDETISAGASEPYGITATATGDNGTSEFSYCRPLATSNLNWVQAHLKSSNTSPICIRKSGSNSRWDRVRR